MKTSRSILAFLLVLVNTSNVWGTQSQWIEKAKAEGKLRIYGTTQIPQMQVVIKHFEKKYPFLEVEYYRAGGEKLAHKIVTEIRAGRHLADVIHISGAETMMLKKMGFLGRYESTERRHIRDIYKDKDSNWTGVYANLELIGYNKTLVSSGDVPRSHKDLLDPRWKGKIGMDPTDVEWYITQLHLLGEAKGREFMQRFAKQDIQLRRGHTLLAQLLAAGEFSLIMTLRDNTAYGLIKKGAPIDWEAIEPVIPNPANAVSLPKRPPHPNAARLWIDYVLSRKGQGILRGFGRNITRADLDPLQPRIKKLRYGKIDWPYYLARYKEYEAEFRETFLQAK
ncbi:MAG: ABC transporter substrate-binding protein [Candidatus Binatia bacterium]